MTHVAVAKKRRKLDLKTSFSTIDGGKQSRRLQKADDLCSGRFVRWRFLFTERKSETQGCVEDTSDRSRLGFMRKRVITPTPETIRARGGGEGWLDVERTAVVEVTSEDKNFPVESAFTSGDTRGWRAEAPGNQTIRLIFDQPQRLKC